MVKHLAEGRGRYVEIHAARPSGDRRAVSPDNSDRDVLGFVDTVGRLYKRLGHIELVKPLVCALVKVDWFAHGRTGNLNHRIAVDRGVGSSRQSVKEPERRHRQQDSGLAGKVAMGLGGHTCLLFMAEPDKADSLALGDICDLCDRYAYESVHCVDADFLKGAGKHIHAGDLVGKFGSCLIAATTFGCGG